MPRERLQKVLAAAGVASRRECEEMVLEGRVAVNGETVDALPVLVDPQRDQILVDGRPVRLSPHKIYILLNKPKGVLSTNEDPEGRRRAVDLLHGVKERVFPVGRLDADSTGLLLLTNDGELAQQLTHPRHGVPKTYRVHVPGQAKGEDLVRLRRGVWLAEGKTHVLEAKIVYAAREGSVLQITLAEGRNREIRRVLAKVGYRVKKLMRVRMGPLTLQGLPVGAYRRLTPAEVDALRKYRVAPARAEKPGTPSNRPRAARADSSPHRANARPRGRRSRQ